MPLRVLLFALLLPTAAQTQTPRALIPQLRHAWVVNLEACNLEASLALYAIDATFINPDGTHAETPADLRKLYKSVFDTFTAKIDLTSRKSGQGGAFAFDSGSYTEIITERARPGDHGVHHVSGDYLTLYHRDHDDHWRILQQVWTETRP